MNVSNTSTLTVNLAAYRHNLLYLRQSIPENCGIMAVVKANAYGHGAVEIAQRAAIEGVELLGVASVREGVELREAGIEAPIMVLVQPAEDDLPHAIRHRLRILISDVATAEKLGDLGRKLKLVAGVHCEIDTGMGRQGFSVDEAPASLQQITRISNVDIEGIGTHFPSADTPQDPFTENQLRVFRQLVRQLDKDGIPYDLIHAANSAGVVNYPASMYDMVRCGLLTYGVWPSHTPPTPLPVQSVATWTSHVTLLRHLPGGASVSYDRTYKAPSPMHAAIVPVGYSHGYRRALSNRAEVLIRGVRCPVRGMVCMDVMVVDVSRVPGVSVGDRVVLMGEDGRERVTAQELAEKADTIPYEILTGIGQNVDREYVG